MIAKTRNLTLPIMLSVLLAHLETAWSQQAASKPAGPTPIRQNVSSVTELEPPEEQIHPSVGPAARSADRGRLFAGWRWSAQPEEPPPAPTGPRTRVTPTPTRSTYSLPTPRYQYAPDENVMASVVVKISCAADVLELNEGVLEALLNSSFILPQEMQNKALIRTLFLGESQQSSLYRLELRALQFPPKPPTPVAPAPAATEQPQENRAEQPRPPKSEDIDAVKFLNEMATKLQDILSAEYAKTRRSLHDQLDLARMELKSLQDELQRLAGEERAMINKACQSNLSRDDVRRQIQQWERREQELEMERMADLARHEALQAEIAKFSAQAKQKLTQDPILEELKNLLEFRQKEMERLAPLIEAGRAPEGDLDQVRMKLAETRIEMEKRREALRQSVGGGVLAKWNEELATISMRLTENAANRQYVEQKLEEIEGRELLQLAARFENEVEARFSAVRQNVYAMQQNISALKERIHLQQPPVVSVLAGQKEKP